MDEHTPPWLVEVQNKSWEPEILISGLTLTFLFLIPDAVYNFFGMLVQDYGVWDAYARMLYAISIAWLVGLKLVLLGHLALRGLWTGLVGLSYVYPHGVNRARLPKEHAAIDFPSPAHFIVRLEKLCSLLFSFIFASIIFVLGVLLLAPPIIALFFVGLDRAMIRTITLLGVLPLVLGGTLLAMILLGTKWKESRLKAWLDTSLFSTILTIYVSNLGRGRTLTAFLVLFLAVTALSYDSITGFPFVNDADAVAEEEQPLTTLDPADYESTRNPKLRVDRATLASYRAEDALELFVAAYAEDEHTLKVIAGDPALHDARPSLGGPGPHAVPQLFELHIDDEPVPELRWLATQHPATMQPGFVTRVPLSQLEAGPHHLTLGKPVWKIGKRELREFKRWQVLPFERETVVASPPVTPEAPTTQNSQPIPKEGISPSHSSTSGTTRTDPSGSGMNEPLSNS